MNNMGFFLSLFSRRAMRVVLSLIGTACLTVLSFTLNHEPGLAAAGLKCDGDVICTGFCTTTCDPFPLPEFCGHSESCCHTTTGGCLVNDPCIFGVNCLGKFIGITVTPDN